MNSGIITDEDILSLKKARDLLENPGLAIKLLSAVGAPIDKGLKMLPPSLQSPVNEISRRAIEKSLEIAVKTLGKKLRTNSSDAAHKLLSISSGAIGGFFGLASLAVELPVSTIIMLRSIADIARCQGEDFQILETRLACIQVFAFGGKHAGDDTADTGYYAVRGALSNALSDAARHIAEKGLSEKSAPSLVRFISLVTSRFGISVSEKVAAQMVPVIGALGGASVNLIFMNHFQDMARGHFTVRSLERKYGKDIIKETYEESALKK